MTIFYSAKNNGFYHSSLKTEYEMSVGGWPGDAVAIMDEYYSILIDGQAKGKVVVADSSGRPTLATPVIDWQTSTESQRQSLLSEAYSTIADWRTELQLDAISDDDKASLIKWMAYIKALKALDFGSVTDEVAYQAISWPEQP